MFADFFIVAAAVVALLALLDLLLAERQKQKSREYILRVWDFLDDLKRVSFGDLIMHRTVRLVVAATCAISTAVGTMYVYRSMEWDFLANVPLLGLVLILSAALAFLLVLWATFTIIFADQPLQKMRRAARHAAIFTIAYALNFCLFVAGGGADPFSLFVLFGGPFQFVIIITFVVVGVFWLLPRIVTLIVAVPLYVVEFVMRRIAESPRGVILAASVLIGAIVAVLRVYVS